MKKLLCTTAAWLLLLGGNEVSAQLSWLDFVLPRNTQFEFTGGYGLFTSDPRPVHSTFDPRTSRRPARSMEPKRMIDYDMRMMPWINERIGLVFGAGMGIFRFDLIEDQYTYSPTTGSYVLEGPVRDENALDFSLRVIAGITYRHAFTDLDRVLVKAYGGVSPNLNSYTPDYNNEFGFFPNSQTRPLSGFEIGWQRDLGRDLLFVPHMLLSYRYLHFYQNNPLSPSHTMNGIHQFVLGFGIAQGKDAWKKSVITF